MEDGAHYAPETAQRYAGIATFLHPQFPCDPSKFDIALIGVPSDGGRKTVPANVKDRVKPQICRV